MAQLKIDEKYLQRQRVGDFNEWENRREEEEILGDLHCSETH